MVTAERSGTTGGGLAVKSFNRPMARLGATGSAVLHANIVGGKLEAEARIQTLTPEEVLRRKAEKEAKEIRGLLGKKCEELSQDQLAEIRRLIIPLAGITNPAQKRSLLHAVTLHASRTGLPLTHHEHKAVTLLINSCPGIRRDSVRPSL